jgi:inosine/xanthosine triphosphatase
MKTIVVASQNPVKKQAALDGFQRMFPEETFRCETVSVPSGVSRQPSTDAETLRGATNRVREAARLLPQADYWIGIEGGNDSLGEDIVTFAWVVILSDRQVGRSRSGTFYLPGAVAELVRAGYELGEADDLVFARSNSKQGSGAIGLLTGDVIDRMQLYEHAVVLALVPFKNPHLYPPSDAGLGKS